MSNNRHRWKAWIDARGRHVLEGGADGLKWAWGQDQKDPSRFPMNTWYMFIQIDEQFHEKPIRRSGIRIPPPPPPPQSFCDLVSERAIRAIYEDQNEGSYKEALIKASTPYEGFSEWRKLLRAVDAAYTVAQYGFEAQPKPRVHFLHRRLLDMADTANLNDLTLEGFVEFFDDVCPCGKKHTEDAIRKLKSRADRASRNRR